MSGDNDDIMVTDFFEFEFYFEMCRYMNCTMKELRERKIDDPDGFRIAAKHVLIHIVTQECRLHVMDRGYRQYHQQHSCTP